MAGCGITLYGEDDKTYSIFQFVDEQDDCIMVEDITGPIQLDIEKCSIGKVLARYYLNDPDDDGERREVLEGILQTYGIHKVLVDACMMRMGLLRVKMACHPDARGVEDA